MNPLPTPDRTAVAREWLAQPDGRLEPIERLFLGAIDGHRNVIELESFARALRLGPAALEHLHQRGLIAFAGTGASDIAATAGSAAPAPADADTGARASAHRR